MPPSGPLVTLYPSEDCASPPTPSPPVGATSPLKGKAPGIGVTTTTTTSSSCNDHENAHPNSSHALALPLLSSLSSDAQLSPSLNRDVPTGLESTATATTPFLEMEDESDEDEYEDAMLEEIPLNDDGEEEHPHLPLTGAPDAPVEEEKKEEDPLPRLLAATSSFSTPLTSPTPLPRIPSTLQSHGVSCGKRQRRRVSFAPPAAQWSTSTRTRTTSTTTRPASRGSAQQNHHPYESQSLVRIADTIHVSEYTLEERLASWYTFADLKSFKKERKETARRIDNGMILLPQSAHGGPPWADISRDETGEKDDDDDDEPPFEFCTRGVEHCTEVLSRIRYRHIADGWRAVLNTQERHNYQRDKLASMSSDEKTQYHALASLFGSGRHKRFPYGSQSSSSSPKNGRTHNSDDSFSQMCCPYDLAAAYLPISEASLDIARHRALGDERDVLADRQENPLECTSTAPSTAVRGHSSIRAETQTPDSTPTTTPVFGEGFRTMDV